MAGNSDDILNAFVSFQNSFDVDQAAREKIRESSIELEQCIRKTMTSLQGIHRETSGNYTPILTKSRAILLESRGIYSKLGACVGSDYYKYHDHWRNVTQKAAFCVSFIVFLETQKLSSKQEVAQELALKDEQSQGFHLDLEDYLHGLLQLVSELSRLAVNSAACGNYTWPVIISKFVNELNAGFRLMNFKNDSLRKHYDCFKYDLKKIEEVVYDLSIRGLKTDGKAGPADPAEATSTST